MLAQTSLPSAKPSLSLRVEADQAASSPDAASERTNRFLWTGFGFAVLMLSAFMLLPLASHASAKSSRDVSMAAFSPTLPALRPGNVLVRPTGLRPARAPRVQPRPALSIRMQQDPSPSKVEQQLRLDELRLGELRLAAIKTRAAIKNEAEVLSLRMKRKVSPFEVLSLRMQRAADTLDKKTALEKTVADTLDKKTALKAETAAIKNEAEVLSLRTQRADLLKAADTLDKKTALAETVAEQDALLDKLEELAAKQALIGKGTATAIKAISEGLDELEELAAKQRLNSYGTSKAIKAISESRSFPQVLTPTVVGETKRLKLMQLTYADVYGGTVPSD